MELCDSYTLWHSSTQNTKARHGVGVVNKPTVFSVNFSGDHDNVDDDDDADVAAVATAYDEDNDDDVDDDDND